MTKTGKSLEQWKVLLAKKSFSKHSDSVNFLKKEFGLTHGFANTIVHLSKTENKDSDDLLTNQYKGKENLLPIYKALITLVKSFGKDVTIIPKKGSVSVIRKKQFTLIKPATKTRIDIGLKLKDKPTTKRLENSGPFGTMCTHRVQISEVQEINKELKNWLKEAYTKAV